MLLLLDTGIVYDWLMGEIKDRPASNEFILKAQLSVRFRYEKWL
jgi:hypothetical protein